MMQHLVILAGGVSSRMKRPSAVRLPRQLADAVRTKPKAMLPVGRHGRPFLDYLLTNIERAGHRHVVIVVSAHDSTIVRYYQEEGGAKRFPNLDLAFVRQSIPHARTKPLGSADALLQVFRAFPEWQGSRITVCNSDNLYSATSLLMLRNDQHLHAMIAYDRGALKFAEERIARFSVIVRDEQGYLTDIIEKPTQEELRQARDSRGNVALSMNLWQFTYEHILPYLESVPLHPVRDEKELPLAVRTMVARHPKSVWTIPVSEHVADLTSPQDIEIVQEYLRKEFPDL